MTAAAAELGRAAEAIEAPDAVFAFSDHGHRTLVTAGTAPRQERAAKYYEIGSVSKTFTGLLLADLVHTGHLRYDTPARTCLPTPARCTASDAITLGHLIAHTSGLPSIPGYGPLVRHALSGLRTNYFAAYSRHRLLDAFHRHRPRTAPGARWRYSNFGVALLGHALAHVATTSYADLLEERILRPLGLDHVRLTPGPPGTNAIGHRGDTPTPPIDLHGFAPAGALRATPADLLTYLEAHIEPNNTRLTPALHAVRIAHTAPEPRRAPARSLTWFHQDTDHGPLYFHGGATFGQHAYLGYRPATGTALVALATRRHTRRRNLIATAHTLLTALGT